MNSTLAPAGFTGPFDYQEVAYDFLEKRLVTKTGRRNLLVATPTNTGKTRVALRALEKAEAGCYVVPTRALGHQKFGELRRTFGRDAVVLGDRDNSLNARLFESAPYRVITYFKLQQMLNNVRQFPELSPVVVFDEVDSLSPDEQLIVATLRDLHPEVLIVALSGTISDADLPKVTQWLDAETIVSTIRPVQTQRHIVRYEPEYRNSGQGGKVAKFTCADFEAGDTATVVTDWTVPWPERHFTGQLAAELFKKIRERDSTGAILFFSQRRAFAYELAEGVLRLVKLNARPAADLAAEVARLPKARGRDGQLLRELLAYGIGLHHGGLNPAEQRLVQQLTEEGKLSVVVACYTFVRGVNFPFAHVVVPAVRDPNTDSAPLIDVTTFNQVAARAGRVQFEVGADLWVVAQTRIDQAEIESVLFRERARHISSKLGKPGVLLRMLPGLILRGRRTPSDLVRYLLSTFWGRNADRAELETAEREAETALIEGGFLESKPNGFWLTPRGVQLARLGIHPAELEALESLVHTPDNTFKDWVEALTIALCISSGREDFADACQNEGSGFHLSEWGLSVYDVPNIHPLTRQLADYLQRMLEISRAYFSLLDAGEEFLAAWTKHVYEPWLYGKLETAKALGPVVGEGDIRRLVRSLGATLKKSPAQLSDEDLRGLAFALYERERRMPNPERLSAVANALTVTNEKWTKIVMAIFPETKGGVA